MMMRHRLRSEESGAVLVIVGLLMVVLLAFAAVAVDLGAAFVGRRTAQNAADIGVLAGALQTAGLPSNADDGDFSVLGPREAAEVEIRRIVDENYGTSDPDWAACSDPDRPAEFTITGFDTPCISFTRSLQRIRVKVPVVRIPTGFARIVGIESIPVDAFAEATLEIDQSGDVLPFGVASLAPPTVACISDAPNAPQPCDGSDAGNFQRLDITLFGNASLGTTLDCNKDNRTLATNIALGADHPLSDSGGLSDDVECNAGPNFGARPQIINAQTGTPQGPLHDGMIGGVTFGGTKLFDGRLTDVANSAATVSLYGETLDNTPLWHFIAPGLTGIPDSCRRASFDDSIDIDPGDGLPSNQHDWDSDLWDATNPEPAPIGETNESFEHMARCLRDYVAAGSTTDLFTVDAIDGDPTNARFDLQRSPRWGYAPVGTFGSGVSVPYTITAFAPIYIETLATRCNGASGCSATWNAGESPQGAFNQNIRAAVAFVIPLEALPDAVNDAAPGSSENLDYILTR